LDYSAARLTVAFDNDLAITIEVAVAIMATLDHDGFVAVAITIFALTDYFTIAITIAVTGTNRHASATRAHTDADADFFGTRRHCNRNSSHRDGSHYKTLDHRMLLLIYEITGQQFAEL